MGITASYFPAVFAAAYLYNKHFHYDRRLFSSKFVKIHQNWAIIVTIILLCTSLVPHGIDETRSDNEQIEYHQLKSPAEWQAQYSEQTVVTDEFTSNVFNIHTSKLEGDHIRAKRMTADHALSITGFKNDDVDSSIIINHNRESMSLASYRIIKSWRHWPIDDQKGLNKVYSKDTIEVYQS
ncbi:hypothetical protein [Natronobeatus ordinarius]|uniref:hypothetical protein n=1 Tax=Natronobeatus ordinarius TaxID=2963433 RepID=UPI0020CBF2B2|nr:hypothetical protein [Natronobeatus ordinarius]